MVVDAGPDVADGKDIALEVQFELADRKFPGKIGHLAAFDGPSHLVGDKP